MGIPKDRDTYGIEPTQGGFDVSLVRQGVRHYAHFAAKRWGGEAEALRQAQAWRDAIVQSVPPLERRAHDVIANLEPFRGTEPDSGTVFEVGAAVAMGRPVIAYGVSGTYAARVQHLQSVVRANGALLDSRNYIVEDFGLSLNLMLACSVKIEASADDALRALSHILMSLGPLTEH